MIDPENIQLLNIDVVEDKEKLLHDLGKFEEFEKSKDTYRKVIQAGIAQWIKDFKKGDIKITTVDDLEKLIKLDFAIQRGEF